MSVTNEKRKLVPQLDLKFINYAIDNFVPSFEFKINETIFMAH